MQPGREPANDACLVRLAGSGDEDPLQRVLDESSGQMAAAIFGHGAADLLVSYNVYLGYIGDVPIGCVMADVECDVAIILNLAVCETHRNRGHASTLVLAAMAHMDQPGRRTYWTATDPGNPSAARRFHLLGFRTVAEEGPNGLTLMVRERDAIHDIPKRRSPDTDAATPGLVDATASRHPLTTPSND